MLQYYDQETDIILNEQAYELPVFEVDEIAKLVQVYDSLDDAKNDFRKRKISLPSETALVVIYDNHIVDYTDYPGNYYWLGTETRLQSCRYDRFLLFDVSEFEKNINSHLDPEKFYIFELNIKDLHSFPLYIENPISFNDMYYGKLNVRVYCSVNARVTNPFVLLLRLIQSGEKSFKGSSLFVGKEDEIRKIFYDGLNDVLASNSCSFENPGGVEYILSSKVLPKLFQILYKGYGIHGNSININSILPDALSKDIIEAKDNV